MTIEETRTLERIGADVSREVALMLDQLFFRVETLERQNRRLRRIVDGLTEHGQPEPLVQAGAFDPRD